ncbi:MAG: S41 family peptidase [bacterium]
MRRLFPILLFVLLLAPGAAVAQQGGVEGFYQDPAVHGDQVVFTAEGDLWLVPITGGLARRLTTHAETEHSPVISPDGSTVAFTATYEGPAEVYTMSLTGGMPVRRTWEPETSQAAAWTPDGRLAYTTSHYATLPLPQMVLLDTEEDIRELVPLSTATEGAWDDDGRTLFFVRPAFHNNVTKRYTGGTARDVWRFGEGDAEAVELTGSYRGESHSPLWWGGRVYFVSDRDGTMNIWSMDPAGRDVRQHTRHSGWDVRDPALSDGRIVYTAGAGLWRYDIDTGDTSRIPVTLASDFEQLRERWVKDPLDYLTSAALHPEGESVVLTARGRLFTAPAGQGRLVRVSRKEGVRYRDAVFTADGERVLALSDETGELEFVTLPADGVGEEEALTSGGEILRFRPHPSPDGSRFAWTDNNRDLWVKELKGGQAVRVTTDRNGVGDIAWSPDSRWIAFEKTAPNRFTRILLYDVREEEVHPLTSDRVNSYSPAWDRQGGFIYFVSDRNLRSEVGSPWGPRAPKPYFERPMEIYHTALRPGLRSPFRPDDELCVEEEGQGPAGSGEDVEIETEGLLSRQERVPVPAGSHSGLSLSEDVLFWLDRDGGTALKALELDNEDPQPVTAAEGIRSAELSMDGKKLLIRRGDDLIVAAARAAKADLSKGRVDLSDWMFSIDVREDWRQIFIDAWRLERDWFYDPGMHGVDWEEVREKYLPLVERVTTREELNDLIGRVVGELSALHTSVRGGDVRRGEDDIGIASLGARLFRDPDAGGYRIDHIYRTDPDYPEEASPLADPYLEVEEGDVVRAVNGVSTLEVTDIGMLLRNQAGRQVLLTLASGEDGETREVVVEPARSGYGLRYSDWEYTRRQEVEEASEGRIGYVHLRAMGSGDIEAWYRQFYPVFDRQGLIIDVRQNNGGNIDSFILNDLLRQAWMYWKERVGEPTWNMQYAFRGHMVVLVDQETASDGEAFAEGFRRLGLGEVIGMRTWGGEIWLSSRNRLSDGGLARAPMMGVYGEESEWLIEQVGVVPDIEVDNLPHATFNGEDAQLRTAIRHLLRKIKEDPRPVPTPPDYPDRSFSYPPPPDRGGR